jgi:hypothetical protein
MQVSGPLFCAIVFFREVQDFYLKLAAHLISYCTNAGTKGCSMKKGLLIFVVFGLFMSIPACRKESEQDRVKKTIATVQKAAEEKDIRKIIDNLSMSYRDPGGNDYNSIKGLLLAYFFRHQKIHVFIPDIAVTIEDSRARAVFQAVLTGGSKTEAVTDILPESMGMYEFDVSLVKESGDWKVTSARWDRLGQNQ